MKIFVSYSRRDAGDFADQIQRHLSSFKYDIFTDVDSIRAGDIWSNTIKENISNCDIFVVIVTYGALQSPHVENEVLQAKRENKKIIPCFLRAISPSKIKWGLENIQGVEFEDKYEITRNLYSKIDIENFIPGDKDAKTIFEPSSTPTENTNNTSRTISSYLFNQIIRHLNRRDILIIIFKVRYSTKISYRFKNNRTYYGCNCYHPIGCNSLCKSFWF